jgi:hypothetical protein
LLGFIAGSILRDIPAAFALENFHLAKYAKWVNAASSAASRGARHNFASSLVNQLLYWHICRYDLRNEATGKLGTNPATFACGMPGAKD